MAEVTIGGNRLGQSSKNMKAHLRDYERSNHDLSFVWRSTMAAGTLVPFMTELALPGDTFDINLNVDVLTHPTIGPLFGTYKVSLDVFQIPFRLYQGLLHMNLLGVGLDMSKIALPQLAMYANEIDSTKPVDNQQINPSSIFAYLGMRGVGSDVFNTNALCYRDFNAIPYLGYWDIYKNYYANKQEGIGAMIHKNTADAAITVTAAKIIGAYDAATFSDSVYDFVIPSVPPYAYTQIVAAEFARVVINATGIPDNYDPSQIIFHMQGPYGSLNERTFTGPQLFEVWQINPENNQIIGTVPTYEFAYVVWGMGGLTLQGAANPDVNAEPEILTFELEAIDRMRKYLLVNLDRDTPLWVTRDMEAPYGPPLDGTPLGAPGERERFAKEYAQEGLALKTYNSDLLNNWINTEWIDGPDGITAVTAVISEVQTDPLTGTGTGSFTIDELNLKNKIYNMLNRIAISGGSYYDWIDAVYENSKERPIENPVYLGGLIRNLVFQEVVSNSRSVDQPLGTLAGRGKMGDKYKGGHIIAKVDEPSYIMGIVSLTPNIDYSQGNKWDTNLQTMDDLHKPALDEIGFQDLITDQMAWWDTSPLAMLNPDMYRSAGKQPAWINYMTNVNVCRGNFADQTQQMFMTLNRRYEISYAGGVRPTIKDVTTYIDPVKFNFIFADTRRDAQNFWVQIAVNNQARRKMSAKIIPNL